MLVYGEHIKMVKNPHLFGALPDWLQECVANDVLRAVAASPTPPGRRPAEVIPIEKLREHRETCSAAREGRGSSG